MPAPSLGQFLEAARAQNPGVSDESLTQYWRSNYASEAPRDASLPTLEKFLHVAKSANPDTPDDDLKAYWQKEYGDHGAAEKEAKRGLVAEVGTQLQAGAAVDLPKMIAQAMEWMGGDTAIGSIGESEKIRSENYAKAHPELAPQIDEKDGIIRRALSRGARAIPPSVALLGPTVAAAPLGAVAGTAVAGAGAFGLFGSSQAQETYDKLKEAGVSDEDATRAGYINLLIEGAGETVGTYFGGKLLTVGAKALGGKTSVAAAIEAATDKAVWKPFAKQLAETAAVETATEFGQNYGETAVEKAYGSTEDTTPFKQGIEGAEAALGMTALLAPFGLAGAVRRARSNEKVATALTDPSVNPIDRIAASKVVYDDIASVSPEAAKAWAENSAVAISDKAPISLDESSAQPAKPKSGVQDILQASNVDDAVTAAMNAVKTPEEIQNQIAGESNAHNVKAAQVEAAYAQKVATEARVREEQTAEAERQRAQVHMQPPNTPYEMPAADLDELRERLRGIAAEQRTRAQRQAAEEPTAPLAEKLLNARRVGETQAQYEARTGGTDAVQEQSAGEGRVQRSAGAGNEIPGEGMGGRNAQPIQAAGTRQAAGDRGAASRQEAVVAEAGVREGRAPTASNVPRGEAPTNVVDTQQKTPLEQPSSARIFGKPVGDLTDAELRLAATNHRMSAHREVAQAEIARRQGATAAQAAPAAETPASRSYTPAEGAQELGRQLGFDVAPVEHKEAPATARMAARVVSKAFGKKVVFVRSGEAGHDAQGRAKWNTDGAVLPDDPSTIYVNLNSNRKWQAVIGHETLHALRRTNEKVYTQLRDAVNSAIDDGAFAWAGKAYAERTKDVQNEEIVANVFGDQMHEPRFWLEVYQHTKDAKALANAAFSTIDKIRSKFAADGRVGNYSAEFVTDAKRVRSAAARAYAQWQKGAESRARLTGGALESKPARSLSTEQLPPKSRREAEKTFASGDNKNYHWHLETIEPYEAEDLLHQGWRDDSHFVAKARRIGESIKKNGQASPVIVGPHGIEGNHRLAASVLLNIPIQIYRSEQALESKPATQTPEFKKWFGESKVVDAQGEPLKMYHGTSKDADFKSFRVSQRGAFFTSNPKEASDYAADNDSMNTMSTIGTQKNRASRVMPVYLSIQNPYVMNEREKVAYASVSSYRKFQSELRNRAIVAGHDGIKFSDDTYVVFKPERIKSAIGNRGTFDAAKSNILESKPADASLIPYLYGGRTPEQFSTMHDLGKFFDERVKKLYGRALDITKPNDRSIVTRALVREARAALEQQDNARGWFRKDVDDAMKAASLVHKEIANDPNHRFAFSVALAITSNGTAVAENVRNAFDAYEKFSKTGKMPSVGYGVRAAAMAKSFATFNTLVKEMGLDGAREALLSKHPAWLLKRAGYDIRELSKEEVYGGSIFGPKIGGAFLPNLNGQYDVPAMDRWFMRTFGRLSGNLASTATETGLRDYPPNPEFRSAARAVLDDVIAKLDVKGMQQSDLQALLWYPEKDLYSMMGVADDSAAPTSYNQEVMNYAREKLKLSAEQLERSLRGVQTGTGRRAGDSEARGREEARADDSGRGNKTAGESSANPIATASAAIAKDESTPRDKSRLGRCHYLVFQKLLENETLKQVIGVVSTWPSAKQKIDGNFKVFIWHSVAYDPKSKNFWEPITNLWYTRAAMRAFGFEPVAALTSEKALALAMKTRMAVSQQQYSENVAPLRGWETDHLLPGDFDSDWKVLQSKPDDAGDLDFTNVEPPSHAVTRPRVDEHEAKVRYTMSRRGSSPRVDWETRPQSGTWISGTADGRYRIEPESGGYTSYAGDDVLRWDRSRQGAIATVNDRYLEDIESGEVRDPLAHKSLLRRYKEDQIERVVGGLKRLAEVKGIFRTGTSKAKTLVDVVRDVDTNKVVKHVHPTGFGTGEGIEYVIVFQNGKPAFVHEDEDEKVAWVDAASLDKGSQLGSFLYPAVFQWVKNAGLKLIPDPAGLSLVNTYRRTEQMLSAALKLGSTEFESPHPDQRLFGWNEDPKTQEDNDKNIAIMALTSMDNTFRRVPQAEEYRFNFETNKFEDGDENEVGAKELDDLLAKNEREARGASIGRTTLARAIFINTFLQDHPGATELAEGEVPNTLAAGLMREPEEGRTLALYSKPDEGRRKFLKGAAALTAWAAGGHALAANDQTDAKMQALLRDGDLQGALKWIEKNGSSPRMRSLATTLSKLLPSTVTVEAVPYKNGDIHIEPNHPMQKRLRSNYALFREMMDGAMDLKSAYGVAKINRGSGRLIIFLRDSDTKSGLNEGTVLHESVHAAIMARYDLLNVYAANPGKFGKRKADDAIQTYRKVWREFRAAVKDEVEPGLKGEGVEAWLAEPYSNPDEFITYALTSEKFQNYLKGKEYKGETLWERFKHMVTRILGFTVSGKPPSWLDAALTVSGDVLDAAQNDAPDFAVSKEIKRVMGDRADAGGATLAHEGALESKPAYIGNSPVANEAARKAGLYRPEKSFVERVKEMVPTFVKRMEQGLVDQFAPIKELDYLSYMLARMSKATDGSVEAMFLYGKPYLESGALNVSMKDGGLTKVLQRLNGEHDRFIAWIAGNRAAQLKTEGRERLFEDAEIDWLKNLNQGQMKDGKSRAALYAEVHKEFNAYSKAVLDIAEQQGIIDPESRAVWEKDFYVPFYRNMDDEVSGPTIKSGLVSQQAFKRLKGGEQELNDLLANTLMNWSHLLSAAMKNKAALSTMEAAVAAGGAIEVPSEYAGKQMQIGKVLKALDGGRERFFVLEDPFLIDAITSLEAMSFGPVAKLFGTVKRWLTVGVTANPSFKVRNLIRDSISSIGVAELPYNPISNIAGAWADTAHSSQLRASALASGAIIRFGTQLEGSRAEYVRDLVNEGIDPDTILDKEHKVVSMLKLAWDRYQEFGDRGENVNRIALYKQLRADGQSHLQASYAARDLLDFSKQGTWRAVRFLVQTVPFFNARVQGLAKLGQGAKENPKRMGYVLGAVALASMALMLAYKDDDDWKKREDWDRDNFWWFKIGDKAFRIPKPFEIGALGSFAERSLEYMVSDEMTGKRFAQRVGSLLMDNLSMNPTPQLVKPLIELYANKDFFQGKPIETQGMQELSKSERIGRNTSAAAQIAGKAGILSPVQIDHVIRSYFGWIGTSATTILEYGLRPAMGLPERPASSMKDAFLVGNFVESLPTNTSRYITDFYNSSVEIKQAYADWSQAMLTHQPEKAKELRAENKDAIALHGVVGSVERRLSVLNRLEKIVLANKDMTPDEKRARLDKLDAQKGEMAKNFATLVAKRRAAKEAVPQ